MATWVYGCEECAQAPDTVACLQCGSRQATRQFELPKTSGGCGCWGSCC